MQHIMDNMFKKLAATLAITGTALFASLAQAAPTGGQVSAGTGAIAQTGTTTTITQQSQNLAIDWNTFSIAADESVRFNQPNASAIALNRILSASPSQIYGNLSANGQVFILNPNGVLFGKGAQVNVGGLVASTLTLNNADFIARRYVFTPLPQAGEGQGVRGAIVNQGTLNAANGGYIALLAPEVRNEGVITATLGTALLAAGDKVTLNLDNGSLLGYSIDQGALAALAENKHLIQADGGLVVMSAKAADALSTAVVNNTGIIEAHTLQNIGGVIKLMGDMQVGQVNVSGTLDASAPNGGNGGFVETSAAHVKLADTARVTTVADYGKNGAWLIDPVDFTIAATGGDISGTVLGTNLGLGDVTILSSNGVTGVNGDVNVNDAVSWSANKLTLNAQRNININANLNGSGTAQLALEYGQGAVAAGNTGGYVIAPGVQVNLPAGGNFSTRLGSNGSIVNYTVITSLGVETSFTGTDLQGMRGILSGNYVLGANIDASPTSVWNAGTGFAPIGDNSTATTASQFTGIFDGLGHTISNLVINRTATNYAGLFGYTAPGSIVRNVGSVGGSVTGNADVGGLVGYSSGSVSNAYATGSVTGNAVIGGLVGFSSDSGTISASYATGSVSGIDFTGGLVGMSYGTIGTSYATGSVSGSNYVGGLAGINLDAISNTYATGSVIGSTYVGGLVGYNNGTALNPGTVSTSYATGSVSGSSYVGGLMGINYGTVSTSYWNTQTLTGIGGGTITGATGLTTAEMMTMASFAGWGIAGTGGAGTVWRIYEGYTNPLLTGFLKPLTVTANDDSQTYDGLGYSGGNGVSYSVAGPVLSGTLVYGGTSQSAVNAGSYTITASGLYSDQQGYDISYLNGALNISPIPLIVTANNNGKVFNDTEPNLATTGVNYSGFVNGETSAVLGGALTLARTGVLLAPPAQNDPAGTYNINASGLTSGNYNVTYAPGVFTISPAGQLLIVMANNNAVYGIDPTGLLFAPIYAKYTTGGVITDLLADPGTTNTGNAWTLSDGAGGGASFTASTDYVLGGNVGNYAINTGAVTQIGSNFSTLALTAGTLTITPLPVTLTAPVAPTKVYDGTNVLAMTSSTVGITNKVGSDIVDITGSGTYADKDVASGKSYTLGNLSLAGAAAGNYSLAVSSLNGTDGVITPAALTVTASAASKTYDGLAYTGGNGVVYTGFANGETSAVLGGTLVYGGASQGAINPGTYLITPGGLTSGNYTISYVNGTLTVNSAGQAAVALGGNTLVLAYNTAQHGISNVEANDSSSQTKINGELITIVNCGMLMPPDAPANTCRN